MKKVLQSTIRVYQQYISPLFPPSCRYYPTCSTYMIEALDKHGAVKGTMMGMARICRCHPCAKAGYDLVPDYFSLKRNNDTPPLESCSN